LLKWIFPAFIPIIASRPINGYETILDDVMNFEEVASMLQIDEPPGPVELSRVFKGCEREPVFDFRSVEEERP
jgi:hypothetical protein